jgi:hypothetical protein
MTQKDKERPGLFDFPLNPTPSLEAYKKFTKHINEYLSMFNPNGRDLSIGPIRLGTPDSPFITSPIEMDPREIERHLRPTTDILKRAIGEAKESINWTRKIVNQIGPRSPEAEKRIQFVEKIVDDIRRLLDDHKGFAWHPRCYEQIRTLVQSSFRPGEPGIAIQITILV